MLKVRASVVSSRNCVGLLDSRRAVARFCFRDWLSLLAPAQAARILAKQDPPVVRWAMMPSSLWEWTQGTPQYAYMKLKSIQEAVAKLAVREKPFLRDTDL